MPGKDLIPWRRAHFGGTYIPSAGAIQLSLATLKSDWLVTKSSQQLASRRQTLPG